MKMVAGTRTEGPVLGRTDAGEDEEEEENEEDDPPTTITGDRGLTAQSMGTKPMPMIGRVVF